MTWPFNKTDTKLEQAESTLSPFIITALSGVDGQVFPDQIETSRLAKCYVYGAIRYLASYDDMRPASFNALAQTMLGRYFDLDSNEVDKSLTYLSEIKHGGKEQLFMIEGASALRRWLVNGDRNVAGDLKNMLNSGRPN